jgi:hypothetical protein
MESLSARVVVTGPDAVPLTTVALSGDRVTVGRLPELNDIPLQPDPELYVSRAAHCTLERKGDRWMLVDGGSVNGTYVRRGQELERIVGRTALRDGDVVCILAAVGTDGVRRYFELFYRQVTDAQRTRAAPVSKLRDVAACLVYEADAARLGHHEGDVPGVVAGGGQHDDAAGGVQRRQGHQRHPQTDAVCQHADEEGPDGRQGAHGRPHGRGAVPY